jgi:hypothetical protein
VDKAKNTISASPPRGTFALVFDLFTGVFTAAPDMAYPQYQQTPVLLGDGFGPLPSAERSGSKLGPDCRGQECQLSILNGPARPTFRCSSKPSATHRFFLRGRSFMTCREVSHADLTTCLNIQPECIGDHLVGREVALRIWRELLCSPSFLGMVIETDRSIAGHRIIACGLGVFVSARFADEEIANPRPGLNSRIIASIAYGRKVVLDYKELGVGNAGEGLDFVNMYGTWRQELLSRQETLELYALFGSSFADSHAGYRLNRILKEAMGAWQLTFARATRIWHVVADFPEAESALLKVVSRETALEVPYSTMAAIYSHREPIFGFREGQQQLLIAALKGATDSELAIKLGMSLPAIKKRWLSIFLRFESTPELIKGLVENPTNSGRGPQKRHRVLSYVREHPEELRPYSKPKVQSSNTLRQSSSL